MLRLGNICIKEYTIQEITALLLSSLDFVLHLLVISMLKSTCISYCILGFCSSFYIVRINTIVKPQKPPYFVYSVSFYHLLLFVLWCLTLSNADSQEE